MARISESRRLVLLTHAADHRRPVEITYDCAKDGEVEVRTIEIHDIAPTKDGNMIVKGWCNLRQEYRTFRVDRILKHRARRLVWRGPSPKITPRFSVFGRVPEKQRLASATTRTYTADGLLASLRVKIHRTAVTA
ncbi:WYL domain-containing protein [Streptomyces sp. CS014]|uniref:WYL domain-containing protein n=1 Tax=Streptomyces sp. CS014 TaxID=2162707 RepID=UPI000D506D57|nr:WYL domain-containing protein [Streptomyces sp. CS014]PVD04468.1 hypothetical protein DBP12_03315 [Streptomyces sp. CS014]